MKIAIVRGFEGVRRQLKAWHAQEEVARRQRVVVNARIKLEASQRLLQEAEWEAYAFELTAAPYRRSA